MKEMRDKSLNSLVNTRLSIIRHISWKFEFNPLSGVVDRRNLSLIGAVVHWRKKIDNQYTTRYRKYPENFSLFRSAI